MLSAVPTSREMMWFDGALCDAADVAIHPFTHALHYGSGVFEGIRAYETSRGTGIFRLHDHLERFYASADVYGLRIPFDPSVLRDAVFATLASNAFSSGYIRPLAYFGAKGISLAPRYACPTHVLIALKPLSGSLVANGGGANVTISRWQKTPSRSLPSTAKACGHYTNSILALQDAVAAGFDEAILLNDRGEIAEGTGENVFLVAGGRLRTNDASADVLPGITRDTVVTLAHERGIPVDVGPLRLADIASADEAFFTGTAAEVTSIARIDGTVYSEHRPITSALADDYARAVRGENAAHPEWVQFARIA